jgi:hypothetical protein
MFGVQIHLSVQSRNRFYRYGPAEISGLWNIFHKGFQFYETFAQKSCKIDSWYQYVIVNFEKNKWQFFQVDETGKKYPSWLTEVAPHYSFQATDVTYAS